MYSVHLHCVHLCRLYSTCIYTVSTYWIVYSVQRTIGLTSDWKTAIAGIAEMSWMSQRILQTNYSPLAACIYIDIVIDNSTWLLLLIFTYIHIYIHIYTHIRIIHIDFVQFLTLLLQVIARIFYEVNRSWSGKITVSELRRSRFTIISFPIQYIA